MDSGAAATADGDVLMRLPWDKFAYRDFTRDTAGLSNSHVGMWIRVLAQTWESPRRGYLLHPSGHPFTDEDTARMLGATLNEWLEAKDVLLRFGIASVDKHSVLFNRRQVREEKTRGEERLRKSESRQKAAKSLSDQQNCPENVRPVSAECPGESIEERRERERAPARSPTLTSNSEVERIIGDLIAHAWKASDRALMRLQVQRILAQSPNPERAAATMRANVVAWEVYYQGAPPKERARSKPLEYWLKDEQWKDLPPAAPAAAERAYVP